MTSPLPPLDAALTHAVLAAMNEAVDAEVLPRWKSLRADEIRSKTADWDLVTDADVGAERLLTASLRGIADLPVVGEEAASADAQLLELVGTTTCWVVDPVDGTRNFVAGEESFACMVALIHEGRTHGAWITYPATGRAASALRGHGTTLDGVPIVTPPPSRPEHLRGAIGARLFLGEGEALLARAASLGEASPIRYCAGWDYLDLLTGVTDFVSFSRSLPWDHAPGALLCEEAGLRSARPDGSEYLPGDGRVGVMSAHPQVWDRVAATLFGAEGPGEPHQGDTPDEGARAS